MNTTEEFLWLWSKTYRKQKERLPKRSRLVVWKYKERSESKNSHFLYSTNKTHSASVNNIKSYTKALSITQPVRYWTFFFFTYVFLELFWITWVLPKSANSLKDAFSDWAMAMGHSDQYSCANICKKKKKYQTQNFFFLLFCCQRPFE